MNIDNAKSQMRKGMLEYCVLLLLSRTASYTNDIIQRLKEADLIVVEGTLYPLLTRLKKEGLLTYALTDTGRQALAAMEETWNSLNKTVEILRSNIGFNSSFREWQK